MSLLKELMKDSNKEIKKSVDNFLKEMKVDVKQNRVVIANTLKEMAKAMESGKPLDEVLKEYDTEATMQLSAILSDAGIQQAKAAKATKELLENILWIALKRILVGAVV